MANIAFGGPIGSSVSGGTGYKTSINTGGFGADVPGRIKTLRQGNSSLMDSLFNLSPYQRARMNPQQQAETQRNFGDTNRAARWGAANDLQRDFDSSNQQLQQRQLTSATNNSMNFFDTASGLDRTRRNYGMQNYSNLRNTPLGQSLFGDL